MFNKKEYWEKRKSDKERTIAAQADRDRILKDLGWKVLYAIKRKSNPKR